MSDLKTYDLPQDVFDSIYNLDQKIKFVEDQYSSQKLSAQQGIIRFLGNTGEIEKRYKKDLNKFNNVEMEELFKSLNIVSKATFNNRKTIIRKYLEWSFSEGLIKLKDFDWFDSFSLSNIEIGNLGYKKYFRDFEDLNNGVATILSKLNPIDNEQYAISYIALYLAWSGLSVEETCNLQVKNIDFENNLIKMNGKTFVVNQFVLDVISKSIKSSGYTTGFKSRNASREFQYEPSDYVIRRLIGADKPNYNEKDLQQRISRFIATTSELPQDNRFYNHTFFLKDVRDSGAFYRIYQYEKETNINIENIDRNILLGLLYVDELSLSKENNFKQDYKNWKNIFYGI